MPCLNLNISVFTLFLAIFGVSILASGSEKVTTKSLIVDNKIILSKDPRGIAITINGCERKIILTKSGKLIEDDSSPKEFDSWLYAIDDFICEFPLVIKLEKNRSLRFYMGAELFTDFLDGNEMIVMKAPKSAKVDFFLSRAYEGISKNHKLTSIDIPVFITGNLVVSFGQKEITLDSKCENEESITTSITENLFPNKENSLIEGEEKRNS